jgi:hypothetical protein
MQRKVRNTIDANEWERGDKKQKEDNKERNFADRTNCSRHSGGKLYRLFNPPIIHC